jgi:uncharacterized protein YbjT (DUF2867 family)
MREDRSVLVIGGTRGTGLLIARQLAVRRVPVRVLARNLNRAIATVGAGIEVVRGDVTEESSLAAALTGIHDIVFTAGCRSGRPVTEARVRAVEYEGVVNTLAAAGRAGCSGRFLYMTASGVGTRSLWTFALNLYKGKTLVWRLRAEEAIRASDLAYTIIRTGVLMNSSAGARAIEVTQRALPLSPHNRIARADVADVFVLALHHPQTIGTTFDVVWGRGPWQASWPRQLEWLVPD